jgi:SAM-dependent methyltransferase
MPALTRVARARREFVHLLAVVRRLIVFVFGPVLIGLVVLHYPYDTDATVEYTPEDVTSARSFYEAAYRPADTAKRGIDYEETAAAAAKTYNVEGNVRDFVARYGLEHKRILEIGSGRGYLQDVVADYTGLDLSSKVASYYHKPFVVGSATNMPFSDNSFDAAWSIWVLEHIPTPERAFEEMRRVIKPGGVIFLAPAWNCPPWLGDGFDARPYSDFNIAGKLVKASIPLRRSTGFLFGHLLPIRVLRRAHYAFSGAGTALRFRRLEPNYEVYWQADSDAAVSLDRYESQLWFESRGDTCLNCGGPVTNLLAVGMPLVIQINKF